MFKITTEEKLYVLARRDKIKFPDKVYPYQVVDLLDNIRTWVGDMGGIYPDITIKNILKNPLAKYFVVKPNRKFAYRVIFLKPEIFKKVWFDKKTIKLKKRKPAVSWSANKFTSYKLLKSLLREEDENNIGLIYKKPISSLKILFNFDFFYTVFSSKQYPLFYEYYLDDFFQRNIISTEKFLYTEKELLIKNDVNTLTIKHKDIVIHDYAKWRKRMKKQNPDFDYDPMNG